MTGVEKNNVLLDSELKQAVLSFALKLNKMKKQNKNQNQIIVLK